MTVGNWKVSWVWFPMLFGLTVHPRGPILPLEVTIHLGLWAIVFEEMR